MLMSIGAAAHAQKKVNAKQPNIIWIMADDLGYADLGCYGQKLNRTRRINKLVKEGVRFTQCYAGGHQNQTGRNIHGRSDDAEDLRPHQP